MGPRLQTTVGLIKPLLKGTGFVRSLLAVGLIVLGYGCGPSKTAINDREDQPEEKVVRVFNWSDYICPEAVARFEKHTGIRVELITFDTQDELIGRVRSARTPFDVVVVEDAVLGLFAELGLLRELDMRRIPNRRNIKTEFARRPADPESRYSVPYHWGTTLLAYRRDRVGDLPATWAVLWDEKFAGRIWMLKDLDEIWGIANLYARRRLAGAANDVMETVWNLVRDQARKIGRYADTLSIADGLAAGACDIGVLYSGDASRAALRNTNIVYVIPEEGTRLWVDNFCVLRDAEHPKAAHAFINFMLDGSVAAMNANYVRFATPNAAAISEIDTSILNDLQLNPLPAVIEKCVFCEKPNAESMARQHKLWSELKRWPAWNMRDTDEDTASNDNLHEVKNP